VKYYTVGPEQPFRSIRRGFIFRFGGLPITSAFYHEGFWMSIRIARIRTAMITPTTRRNAATLDLEKWMMGVDDLFRLITKHLRRIELPALLVV
jgi:hypothetical protein